MSRMQSVKCPDCGEERQVRLSNYQREGTTKLCLSCFSKTKLGKRLRDRNKCYGHKHEGYVFLKVVGHPRATKEGFVKRAVLAIEGAIGRKLSRQEHIHHINGIRDDDRLENLTVMTNSEHAYLHMKAHPNIKNRYQMVSPQR